MTRTEIEKRLTALVTELAFTPDRDAKHEATADVLMMLHQALTCRVEHEFVRHCYAFDPRAALAALDAEARARRLSTGQLVADPAA
jgi:hypothetical protein